jgi:hypothetical protein
MSKREERTDNNIMKIILSFFGANENLLILEKEYLAKDIITIPQYVNFLSQVALCIELGMKSILIQKEDILKTHDLKELYYMMPKTFLDKFEKSMFPKKTIEKSLEKIRNIFEDFRYMKIEHLDFFVDNIIFTMDYKVIFSQILRLQNFRFIIFLLDEIKAFYNYLYESVNKNYLMNFKNKNFTLKPDNTELLKAINKYYEDKKQFLSS